MECYLMLERNELLNHDKTWKDLKNILSERNQTVKATDCMIWHSGKGKTKGRVKK